MEKKVIKEVKLDYGTAASCAAVLTLELMGFLDSRDQADDGDSDLMAMYTSSPDYLRDIIAEFHLQIPVMDFIGWIASMLRPDQSIIDVGCSCGFTGLTLAMSGHQHVSFYDYEGLGLQFIRWFAARQKLNVSVYPYDEDNVPPRHSWSIALDVIEHTGNHLSFLAWMRSLGDAVALSIPHVPYHPPFVKVVDEWVDKEALLWVIERRYELMLHSVAGKRTFMVYQ